MPDDGDVQYEHKSVKVIRGREASTIAKMQNDRWELVSQTQGTLRTEITFRRVKKWSFAPWMGAVALLGVGILLLGGGALFGGSPDDDGAPESRNASSSATPSEGPSEEPTEEPSEPATPTVEPSESATATEEPSESATPAEEPTEEPTFKPTETKAPAAPVDGALTMQNSADLKALLQADDDYSLNNAFARNYKGREIQFNGSIADATPGYYLVYFGDDSDTNVTSGPAFQFRVQNLLADGRQVATGDNLRFAAEVGAFNADQGLFSLTPVKISAR